MHAASPFPLVLRIASTLGKTQGTFKLPDKKLATSAFQGQFLIAFRMAAGKKVFYIDTYALFWKGRS